MAQRRQMLSIIEIGVAHRQMNDHLLHDAVVALAQQGAHERLTTSAAVGLTDNSGGTPAGNGPIVPVVTPVVGIVDGVTAFAPKAGFDTATAAIEAAHAEIAGLINEQLEAMFVAGGVRVELPPGATIDATIGAITSSLTAATSGCVSAATARLEINKARNAQATLAAAINYLRTAIGAEQMNDLSGGKVLYNAGWRLDESPRAVTAAAATNGQETLTDASVDAVLGALRNNIASLADMINGLLTPPNQPALVVAVQNPRTRTEIANP